MKTITRILAFVVLGNGLGYLMGATPATGPASAPASPLKVEVVLAAGVAAPAGEVTATFRVTNISAGQEKFDVWNCDWPSNWVSNNAHILVPHMECGKNFVYSETLAPGKAYERTGVLQIAADTPAGEQTFKVGFQPEGAKAPLWSNELKITIKAGKP
jgi:hypothetical protein